MRYEELSDSIKQTNPSIHDSLGIKTIDVIELLKKQDTAFFIAPKSNKTASFFIAIKMLRYKDDSWIWWCPTEDQVTILTKQLMEFYANIDRYNSLHRTREVKT